MSASNNMDNLCVHDEKLKNLCRICGRWLQKDSRNLREYTYDKLNFKDELKAVYGINVETESPSIYPQFICLDDGKKLYQWRKPDRTAEWNEQLPQFSIH